jgi:hypothetical protein
VPGRIRFEYRSLWDVVIAHVEWHLETREDLELWYAQYEAYFRKTFSRKVDLILELSHFHVNPRIAAQYRTWRNRMLREFTTRSYRVNAPANVRSLMYAGYVLTGGPANQFDSIERALEALRQDREQGEANEHLAEPTETRDHAQPRVRK